MDRRVFMGLIDNDKEKKRARNEKKAERAARKAEAAQRLAKRGGWK